MSGATRDVIYLQIEAERLRQDAKWGEQNHPDGTGGWLRQAKADSQRMTTTLKAEQGNLTWEDILAEEFFEAMAETEPGPLREELTHLIAVAVCWIEHIERRHEDMTHEASLAL